MSQILSGHRFGTGFSLLFGTADPNSASAPPDVQGASQGYVYFRTGANSSISAFLYYCDTSAVLANGVLQTAAHWTAK